MSLIFTETRNRTLFWGGDTFAPKLKIKVKDGSEVPVQQFLQGAFLDMIEVLVRALGDLDAVMGFEVNNHVFISCGEITE
jgi:hypothetical protein